MAQPGFLRAPNHPKPAAAVKRKRSMRSAVTPALESRARWMLGQGERKTHGLLGKSGETSSRKVSIGFSQENLQKHPGNIHSSQWIAGEIPIFPWKNGQITEHVPLSQPIETDNARKHIPSKVRITTINMIYHDFKFKHQTQGLDQYNWIQLVEYCVIYPRRHNPHK